MKKAIKTKLISIICLVVLIGTLQITVFAQSGVSDEAKEHIISQLERANIPNSAVAIIRDGETSYILENSQYDTLFEIGSTAKPFTAFGVLVLEEMGLLSVTDPVTMHLPWFETHYNGTPVPNEDMRIYNLLQHTSGLTHDERRFPVFTVETTDEFIVLYSGIELAFYPSTNHLYSNANYVLLGILIETVTDLSYDEFMTQYVLHPLGMYNTFTSIENAHATGQAIGGYRRAFFRQTPVNIEYSPLLIPSGHIYSNISDMARWTGIHMGLVDIPEQFVRVVERSQENFHISVDPFADFDFHHVAGGWLVWEDGDSIEHMGATPGYFAIVRMLESENTAVVILGNLGIMAPTVNQLGNIALDAVIDGNFDRVGVDFYVILDVVLNVAIIWGVISLVKFIRLIVKTVKQIRDGHVVRYNEMRAKWLLDLVFGIAVLAGIYFVLPNIFSLPATLLIAVMPINLLIAIVFAWLDFAHSLFGLWTKMFVSPQKN